MMTTPVAEFVLTHLELVVSSLAVGKPLYTSTLVGERTVSECPISTPAVEVLFDGWWMGVVSFLEWFQYVKEEGGVVAQVDVESACFRTPQRSVVYGDFDEVD